MDTINKQLLIVDIFKHTKHMGSKKLIQQILVKQIKYIKAVDKYH